MSSTWNPHRIDGVPDGTILFDGMCMLCSWWVQFVIARDPRVRFRFLAVQSGDGRDLATQLGIDPDDPQTNAVILAGVAYFKSDAALRVLAGLRGWGWAVAGAALPRPLRNWIYDRVARNRYEWFGRREVCLNPTSDQIHRHFVE